MEHLLAGPVTVTQIKTMTCRDKDISRVLHYVKHGWPESVDLSLHPYVSRKHELRSLNGCVVWGTRVVVPAAARMPENSR